MILRMSILLRQDLFLIQKNFVQLWLFEFYVPISFFIDFNERKNQNLRAIRGSKKIESNFRFEIDFSNRLPSKRRKGKTTPVRRAQGGGIIRRIGAWKKGRGFRSCRSAHFRMHARSLSPLSHYLKLQSIDRRRDGAETWLCSTWSQYK